MAITNICDKESGLIQALRCIVLETMSYSPEQPYDSNSYLPEHLVSQAQQALAAYDANLDPVFGGIEVTEVAA